MKKITLLIVVFAVFLSASSSADTNVLDGQPFESLTKTETYQLAKKEIMGSPVEAFFVFVHSDANIKYNISSLRSIANDIEKEKDLKANNTIIIMNTSLSDKSKTDFSIAEFVSSFELVHKKISIGCRGYHDICIYDGISGINILGYLLFPKIDNIHGQIKLINNYRENDINVIWDIDKINDMIKIFEE